MKKVKRKEKYTYDYPELRALRRYLHLEDLKRITELTGYSQAHVCMIFRGERKMPKIVLQEFEKLSPEAHDCIMRIPTNCFKRSKSLNT